MSVKSARSHGFVMPDNAAEESVEEEPESPMSNCFSAAASLAQLLDRHNASVETRYDFSQLLAFSQRHGSSLLQDIFMSLKRFASTCSEDKRKMQAVSLASQMICQQGHSHFRDFVARAALVHHVPIAFLELMNKCFFCSSAKTIQRQLGEVPTPFEERFEFFLRQYEGKKIFLVLHADDFHFGHRPPLAASPKYQKPRHPSRLASEPSFLTNSMILLRLTMHSSARRTMSRTRGP
eukprot:m.267619 g.267619  ORF g.267619 m.267619 type:complete len:236 (+) comp11070_c1_seq24:515-1222(+)